MTRMNEERLCGHFIRDFAAAAVTLHGPVLSNLVLNANRWEAGWYILPNKRVDFFPGPSGLDFLCHTVVGSPR